MPRPPTASRCGLRLALRLGWLTSTAMAVQSTLSIDVPPPSRTPEPQEPAAAQASHPLPPLPPGTPKALPAASASAGPPAAATAALTASEPAPVPQLVTGAWHFFHISEQNCFPCH